MEGKTTYAEIDTRDIWWLLDVNEALDVWRDQNNLDVTLPHAPGFQGTDAVRLG